MGPGSGSRAGLGWRVPTEGLLSTGQQEGLGPAWPGWTVPSCGASELLLRVSKPQFPRM